MTFALCVIAGGFTTAVLIIIGSFVERAHDKKAGK